MEADYRRREFDANARWTSVMMACASILAAAFVSMDKYLVPPDALAITSMLRVFGVAPIPLVGVAANYLLRRNLRARDLFMFCGAITLGSIWTVLIWIGGPVSVPYHTVALIHTLLIAFFLLDLPFRLTVSAGVVVSLPFILVVYLMGTPLNRSLLAYGGITAVLLICGVAAYRYESASRNQFVAQRRSQLDTTARLATETDRRRWLELFAGFLQHELRNAIAGVGSSLALVRRLLSQPPGSEYIERADRSLQFMRRMLQQVAEATTLESALSRDARESVEFGALVRERIAELHTDGAAQHVIETIAPDLLVLGNADSLVQMIDKLLNNAVEHASSGEPIRVCARREGHEIVLAVEDIGDPLPADCEPLFEPFVSAKSGARSSNLGLGLYVARSVASHHGGAITAEPLVEASGARFIVRLPAHEQHAVSNASLR